MHPLLSKEFVQLIYHLYNSKIWPSQLLLLFFGVMGFYFCFKMKIYRAHFISITLVILWFWCSLFFFPIISEKIGYIAYFFVPIYLAYGIFIFYYVSYKKYVLFKLELSLKGIIGIFFISYVLVLKIILGETFLNLNYLTSSSFGTPSLLSIYSLSIFSNIYGKKNIAFLIPPYLWFILELVFVGFYEPIDMTIFILTVGYSLISYKTIKPLSE
jgi:hypothetical protein